MPLYYHNSCVLLLSSDTYNLWLFYYTFPLEGASRVGLSSLMCDRASDVCFGAGKDCYLYTQFSQNMHSQINKSILEVALIGNLRAVALKHIM